MNPFLRGPLFFGLVPRLMLALTLASLPVGMLAYRQTSALDDEILARAEDSVLGKTVRVAETQMNMISMIQGMLAGVASSVDFLMQDPMVCSALMNNLARLVPEAAFVGFVPKDGRIGCSNASKEFDVSTNGAFQNISSEKTPTFTVSLRGPVSGLAVMVVTHPVFDAQGSYLGYIAISLPQAMLGAKLVSAIDDIGTPSSNSRPLYFWTFDREGALLTSNVDLVDAETRLPLNLDLKSLVGKPAHMFQATSGRGLPHTYAVVPVMGEELYLMSVWDAPPSHLIDQLHKAAYLSPFVMWLVGLLVAGFAAERLVGRHVRTLHQSIRAFSDGDRRLEPVDLAHAPFELRDLGHIYRIMTEAITKGEARLQDDLYQKEALLHEVNHRARNNLQLIYSIINIQKRNAVSPEAKTLLQDLYDRIKGLGTIHSELYQTSGQVDIAAAELLPWIARQITAMPFSVERRVRLDLDFDDVRLIPDQAVPLALFLTEGMVTAIKSSEMGAEVQLALKTSRNEAKLSIRTTRPANTPLSDDARISEQLIAAFAQQLSGILTIDATGVDYTILVRMPVAKLRKNGVDQAAAPAAA